MHIGCNTEMDEEASVGFERFSRDLQLGREAAAK